MLWISSDAGLLLDDKNFKKAGFFILQQKLKHEKE